MAEARSAPQPVPKHEKNLTIFGFFTLQKLVFKNNDKESKRENKGDI